MGFIVVTEEPSSREVGDVVIVGDSRQNIDLEWLRDSSRFGAGDVSEIWNRESSDVEEEIAEDQDDEEADEEEDDEADAEAEDDDTDSERA